MLTGTVKVGASGASMTMELGEKNQTALLREPPDVQQ